MYYTIILKPNTLNRMITNSIQKAVRKWHNVAVKDKDLADRMTPTYSMGAKRITPSDEYLKTFNEPHVKLCDEKIEAITKTGIKTSSQEHNFEAIIYATGFNILAASRAVDVFGLNGKHLQEEQGNTPKAYLGITHNLAPNSFVLLGPGTGLGHGSAICMIECQVEYSIDAIKKMIAKNIKSMVVKKKKLETYFNWTQEKHKKVVFGDNNEVVGWYRNEEGVNYTLYPGSILSYWWITRKCNLEDFLISY